MGSRKDLVWRMWLCGYVVTVPIFLFGVMYMEVLYNIVIWSSAVVVATVDTNGEMDIKIALCAFRRGRKSEYYFYMSVRPSAWNN